MKTQFLPFRHPLVLSLLAASLFWIQSIEPASTAAQDHWARWRGPQGNGIVDSSQRPPTRWSETENIVWKTKLPGRGHASPIVVGERIFLATADESKQSQSVLCIDRTSGKRLWETVVNVGEFPKRIHPNNTHASSTVATDGQLVFAVFHHHGSVFVTALDFQGEKIWEQRVGKFDPHYDFGFGASPIVHADNVIVTSQSKVDSVMKAYRCSDGELVWKHEFAAITNYSTPVVARIRDQETILLSGQRIVAAYDPANGKQLWQSAGKWDVTCATVVWDDELVFASGGYPAAQTLAIKSDGSGAKVWENNQKSYEQSMLLHNGFLYTHTDGGIVFCWRAKDGQEMWKQRFNPNTRIGQSASPVLVNGNIYITAENGETLVMKTNPEKLDVVSRNKLGDAAFASLAVCGNQIFARVAFDDPANRKFRQEWLYCIGDPAAMPATPSASEPKRP